MHRKYADRGFEVLAFPCKQFANQEFDTAAEVLSFVEKYGAKFPMMQFVDVNGKHTHPVYQYLKRHSSLFKGGKKLQGIQWNFGKFLVDKRGDVVEYFPPSVQPITLTEQIEELLD
ncbi:MAG: uncharacterized protein KVP18_004639 [Porospora cf. gigantea A]|nr:MAG: hypothetical protein KVP18_004639 [Porospora cf. gigantea A]